MPAFRNRRKSQCKVALGDFRQLRLARTVISEMGIYSLWIIIRGDRAMGRTLAALAALVLVSTTLLGAAPSERVISEVRAAATLEAQTEKTAAALDHIFALACFNLRREGHDDVADQVCGDWERRFRPYLVNVMAEGLGDHKPLSEWLAVVCMALKSSLGEFTYVALHLDDLEIINFGLPVMFDPHASAEWCRELPDDPCDQEYKEHAAPVIGVTSYWLAYWGCTAGTMGAGALVLICTPVGMLTESIVMIRIAPGIAERIWARANPPH